MKILFSQPDSYMSSEDFMKLVMQNYYSIVVSSRTLWVFQIDVVDIDKRKGKDRC